MNSETILVLIPAYRDVEVSNTIKSALKQAEKPEKLFFGIVNQYGNETKNILDLFKGGGRRYRIAEVPWQETSGVGWARHLIEDFYRNEEFILQIDAHMQFGKNWDRILKENWKKCHDDKAVLSTYPMKFELDEKGDYAVPSIENIRVELHPIKDKYTFTSGAIKIDPNESEMKKTLYATGGLEFFRGEVLNDVRYVKEIIFTGEEIVRSLQMYTFGYNIYIPVSVPIFHHYGRKNEHRFWEDVQTVPDLKKYYEDLVQRSDRMVKDIMSGKITPYQKYFGNVRKVEDFLRLYDDERNKQN